MQKIKIEDFEEWKNNPVTIEFFKTLKREASVRRELIASGACKKTTFQESAEEYYKLITSAEIFDNIINIEFEEMLEEEDENNTFGIQSPD